MFSFFIILNFSLTTAILLKNEKYLIVDNCILKSRNSIFQKKKKNKKQKNKKKKRERYEHKL